MNDQPDFDPDGDDDMIALGFAFVAILSAGVTLAAVALVRWLGCL